MRKQTLVLSLASVLSLSGAASAQTKPPSAPPGVYVPPQAKAAAAGAQGAPKATVEQAKAYAQKLNADLKALWTRSATAEWIKNTYITDDTERNAASVNEEVLAYTAKAIKESVKYDGLQLDADTKRMFHLLRISTPIPAPDNEAKRKELTQLAAKMEGIYGKGKYCRPGEQGDKCRNLLQLSKVLSESRNYDELLDAWKGWHDTSKEMRPLYAKLVDIANEGAREINYANVGDLWRSSYDMPPAEFEKETDRLWQQVKPLYDDLHCYVRGKLQKKYGKDKVPDGQAIPAHLLGNMWAQEWANIYPLVEPYPGQSSLDVTSALVKKFPEDKKNPYSGEREKKFTKVGEAFFTSLGMNPLPETFWERSQFFKPRDREVQCHASAWDVTYENDLRIKMCIKVDEEDLVTIHHELGHIYYYNNYYNLPVLYQGGANDGFHEAIGDALTLSMTPEYYKNLGLLKAAPKNDKALVNLQMKDALEKIAFLPFGKLIDQWRWDVYSGKTKPENYNAAWWALREKYQGVKAPIARSEADFDPGAKYHIPANVPYTRYFLARILQFQFHKAMCEAAGFKGALHECSIYGNKAAGEKLKAMLALGASKPWPDAMAALTGQRQMDATPMLDYFAPLRTWLAEQNKGQKCGW